VWRVPWLLSCAVVLVVLVAVFARIELHRTAARIPERSIRRDGATALGIAAVLAGLLGVALSGSDYHGITGLPWGAVVSYLFGAAVLRVVRAQPIGLAARHRSRPPRAAAVVGHDRGSD
jgi:hypothetical protein